MVWKACLTLAAAIIALNAQGWRSPVLGMACGTVYLLGLGWLWGGWLKHATKGWYERVSLGLVLALAGVSIIGSIMFYLARFSSGSALAIMFLLPWLGTSRTSSNERAGWSAWEIAAGSAALVLTAATLVMLAQSGTNEAIRTPWSVIPPVVLLGYGVTAAAYITLARLTERSAWLAPFFFLSLSLLPLVYAYGFGFDAHIHQATESALSLTGTITPKPFYYVGQYTAVTWLAATLGLAAAQVDTWFIIIFASLALPALASCLVRSLGASRPWTLLLTLTPLAFAPAAFTYTTPQSVSFLYALASMMLVALRLADAKLPAYAPWLLAAAAAFTQPITGLPLLCALGLWWIVFEKPSLFPKPKLARWISALATVSAVPLAFAALGWLKPSLLAIGWNAQPLSALAAIGREMLYHLPMLPDYVEPADAAYVWGKPLTLLLLALAAAGAYYAHRNKFSKLTYFAVVAGLFTLSYLVLRLFITFDNLPPNEQGFYSSRLVDLALLSLWPLVLIGAYAIGAWVLSRLTFSAALLIGALLLTAGFYLTYPRLDAWHKDTAYNTTRFDAQAVLFVEREAGGLPYVALANQAVSAAAVRTYGFDRYRGGHYFYPLPTGSNPLYRVYLNAAQDGLPTRDVIAEAARLGGVPQVFLVLNRYWADYELLTQMATKEADEHWDIADGRLTIYRFDF